jgi:hypothetical protein
MRLPEYYLAAALIAFVAVGCQGPSPSIVKLQPTANTPRVIAPPEAFFQKVREPDRETARKFYRKYLEVEGMPVAASAEVDDRALQRTYYIVTHLLAGRPDILRAMVTNGTRLIIIGKNQVYMSNKKWRGTPAVQNRLAYWAEGVLAYFNATGQEGIPNDAPHPIATRELLKEYDPDLFALVNETMAYDGHVDWRYTRR